MERLGVAQLYKRETMIEYGSLITCGTGLKETHSHLGQMLPTMLSVSRNGLLINTGTDQV